MWQEFDLLGVFMTPLIPYMAVALVPFLLLRPLLRRAQRWVWHPPLMAVALYLCVLAALVALL